VTADYDKWAAQLGSLATRSRPLGPLTTYGVGGPAALFLEIEGPEELDQVRRALKGSDVSTLVIGRGSNLLVSDAGFDGVALRLGAGFASVRWPERSTSPPEALLARAGAALPLPVLARQAADTGWAGLAWAVGVPGSVGGAVRMNAGGHGSDMAACLQSYTWVDLVSEAGGTDPASRLQYGYRSSSVRPSEVVLGADIVVTPGEVDVEQKAVADIVRWRRAHQPGGSNAGSVFTNPEGDSAGRLIDAAGLKGFRLGTAQVSEKHANFIQADKGGRADDVRSLMSHVGQVVLARCGVTLTAEVRLLGFGGRETGPMERATNGDGQ
jgi:UDP-N-acetylmuramate dehydrogenase